MKPTENIEKFIKNTYAHNLPAATSAKLDQRVLSSAQETLEKSKTTQSAGTGPNIWRMVMKTRITKLAAAAVIIIAVLIGINQYGGSVSFASVAWADVVKSFESVNFFSAAIYMKDKPSAEPKQFELWMGEEGRARMRVRDQVLFTQDGQVTDAFNFVNSARIDSEQVDDQAEVILRMLGQSRNFSLDIIVKTMFKGKLQEVTPLINLSAGISEDMVVFDVTTDQHPQWMRIWALRQSQLPVRIRVWDPRDGSAVDIFITYSKEQPDKFFDAKAYEEAVVNRFNQNNANSAYAFLKDPGGRDYVPQDLFKKSGYHLPKVEQVGVTEYGAVWVMSSNSRNKTPDDYLFDGFGELADELGTEYRRIKYSGDNCLEVFVPEDYPFGKTTPSKLTLTCRVEFHYPHLKPELIGSVELTDMQNIAWPRNATRGPFTECNVLLDAARWYCQEYRIDMCERIVGMALESDDGQRLQGEIDKLRIKMFIAQEKGAQAAKLALELWPGVYDKYKNPDRTSPTPYDLVEFIVAVAYGGEIDKAAQLWKQVKETEHNLKGNKSWKKYVAEELKKSIPQAQRGISIDMAQNGNSLEDISRVIGMDVRDNAELKACAEQAKRDKYLAKLSEYYNKYPLSEKMELLERETDQGVQHVNTNKNRLPGHQGYVLLPINYRLKDVVLSLPGIQGIYPIDKVSYRISEEVSEELLNKEIRADVVRRSDVSLKEAFEFVLNHYGLKVVVEDGESRKVWVARYNGKVLRNYKNVHVPLPNLRGTVIGDKPGTAGSISSHGMCFNAHLTHLAFHQNKDIEDKNAKKIFIDETGIMQPISMETAYWPGDEGFELARKWFEEEFGITFTEEVRPMKILVIRNK